MTPLAPLIPTVIDFTACYCNHTPIVQQDRQAVRNRRKDCAVNVPCIGAFFYCAASLLYCNYPITPFSGYNPNCIGAKIFVDKCVNHCIAAIFPPHTARKTVRRSISAQKFIQPSATGFISLPFFCMKFCTGFCIGAFFVPYQPKSVPIWNKM